MADAKTFQNIIAERIEEYLGLSSREPLIKSAAYMTGLDIKDMLREIIGPDDMSEAAQKLRAALRKM